ncbi:NAD(P)-binding protein [Nitratireductor mangrovi]|uniref:NAD(P)-binding protein n=1 Tax=Nitratireductor mangrovi TaxID=2599600 RepID=A0A5B8L4R7_9HYPH|nr:FAD-dependent oxidoreductase [Nitratireductor mangrovi]QDZ02812.1 NAD(P)-binding protein [Nitratireductor mangrovi]
MRVVGFGCGASSGRRRIAIVGSGISGAAAAWALAPDNDITLFEAADRPGGHTATVTVDHGGVPISVDTGFIVYNDLNYPELTALFAHLGVVTQESPMSFSLSLDGGRLEWSGQTYRTIFAQKRNFFSPSFLWMLREILRFNRQCVADREAGLLAGVTIGEYLARRGFSAGFRDNYLIPMAAAIWSTPRARMLDYPAATFVSFFENHRLIHHERPVWRTVTGGAKNYLERLLEPVKDRLRLATPVTAISCDQGGVTIFTGEDEPERFDEVVLACHSDQALDLLQNPSPAEAAILSAIAYRPNRAVLHRDRRLMPKRRTAWAAWNYLRTDAMNTETEVCVTYWMNALQGIDRDKPLFLSLNPIVEPAPEKTFGEWTFEHPQFDAKALSAQSRLEDIQGRDHCWFAGAWTGHGFHEDGLRSGLDVAERLGASIPWRDRRGTRNDLPIAAE